MVEALAQAIRGVPRMHVPWSPLEGPALPDLNEIVTVEPENQIAVVQAGVRLDVLNRALEEQGQCLPCGPVWGGNDELGKMVAANLPHALEGQCGSWRDWLLGATIILADGTVVKSGSRAVKNVAGYDLHKLLVGSRHIYGLSAELILRTLPLKALPEPQLEDGISPEMDYAQRVLPTDYEAAKAGGYGVADPVTCTLWGRGLPHRFPGDWVLRLGPQEIEDSTQARLMRRAKTLFDPGGKFNPGAFVLDQETSDRAPSESS